MKLSINTDFTRLPRAGALQRSGQVDPLTAAVATLELPHDERHLRRRSLALHTGERILVDLPAPVALASGDRLVLDDGRQVEITAAPEQLLEVRARDALHLTELAWHIGNRHLAAAIETDRILVLRDHVICAMLEGLGAAVRDVVETFEPMRGAYGGEAHVHAIATPRDNRHVGDEAQGHHGAMAATTTSTEQ